MCRKLNSHNFLFRQSSVDYVYDTVSLADNFYDSALEILKSKSKDLSIFIVAGYLAAHSAELYMKAYLIASNPSRSLYEKFRKISPKHDLVKLLNVVIEIDKDAIKLETIIRNLNKYSGDKVRFAEYSYDPNSPKEYGTDEIWPIKQIRNYFRVRAYR